MLFYVSAVLLSIFTIYFFNKKKKEDAQWNSIPYPPAICLPIFGHMLSLAFSPFQTIDDWQKKMGPIFKFKMGSQLWIMIDDPYLAHDIFVTAGATTSSRLYQYFLSEIHSVNGRGVMGSEYGSIWKNNRKSVANALKPDSVSKYLAAINLEFKELIYRLEKQIEKQQIIDPWENLQLTIANIVTSILANKRFNDTDDPEFKVMSNISVTHANFMGVFSDFSFFFPCLSWVDIILGRRRKMKLFSEKKKIVYEKMIQKTLQDCTPSLIKELYDVKKKSKSITEVDIFVIFGDIIGAGIASPANTTYWTLAILALYPEVQDRIIQEINVWKSKNPLREYPTLQTDFESFIYSVCVQKEVLRFRPPGAFNPGRKCTKDTVVNGYHIPKGAGLFINFSRMQHHPSVFEDPEVFRPERYLSKPKLMSTLANGHVSERDQYIFSWGRRNCPGIYLTESMLLMFYFHFFSNFTVRPASNNLSNEELLRIREVGIGLKPYHGTFRIIPRNK